MNASVITNKDLVDLVREKTPHYLDGSNRDERVLEALAKVDRRQFLSYRKQHVLPLDPEKIQQTLELSNEIEEDSLANETQKNWCGRFSTGIAALQSLLTRTIDGNPVIADLGSFSDWYKKIYGPMVSLLEVFTEFQVEQFGQIFEIFKEIAEAPMYKENVQNLAYVDLALPIAKEQTCSQPSMVAFMADVLKLEPGMNVYEVGTGCGYSATLTASLIEDGNLITVERIPVLAKTAMRNILNYLGKLSLDTNIRIIQGDGKKIYTDKAPYDRIYLTAGVGDEFDSSVYREHLTDDGLLLYPPIFGPMILENKEGKQLAKYESVRFVPLV